MLKCGIENSLRDVGLENGLHGTMNDGRDGCASSRAKRGCCSNTGDRDLELCDLWSRSG